MTTCFTSPTVWYMIEKCKKSIANWKQKGLAFKVKVAPSKHVSCRGETQPWLWRQAVCFQSVSPFFKFHTCSASPWQTFEENLSYSMQTMGDRNKLLATARSVLVQRPATSSNNPPTWWGITHYSLETVVSRPVWLRPDKCTNIRNNPSINKLADCYISLFDTP